MEIYLDVAEQRMRAGSQRAVLATTYFAIGVSN
jgi:hypothetical protein